jgi:hypothetical protein
MNKRERQLIFRIYEAFRDIPFPKGYGTSTASVAGLSSYASDMRNAQPLIQDALSVLTYYDAPEEAIEDAIQELESWIAKRKKEDWR